MASTLYFESTFVSPFPLPEELFDLDSRVNFRALIKGNYQYNLEGLNSTIFGSIPWALFDFIAIDVLSLSMHEAYKLKLIIRFVIIIVLLILIFFKFIQNWILSSIIAVFTVSNFNFLNSIAYSSKFAIYTLFLGGVLAFIIKKPKWAKLSFLLTLIVSFPIISNLSNLVVVIFSLSLFLILISNKTKDQVRRILTVLCILFLVYIPIVITFYFNKSTLTHYLNYSKVAQIDIKSSPIQLNIIGSGYWAEFQKNQKLSIFSWAPEHDSFIGIRQVSTIVIILLLILIVVQFRNRNVTDKTSYSFIPPTQLYMLVFATFTFLLLSSINIDSRFFNMIMAEAPVLQAFREPWVRFEPIYVMYLSLTICVILSYLREKKFSFNFVQTFVVLGMVLNSCLFMYSSVESSRIWKVIAPKYAFDPSLWMLYSVKNYNDLNRDYEYINKKLEESNKTGYRLCLEINYGSRSFQRDMLALGRLHFDYPILAHWHSFGLSEGSNKEWQSWNCFSRSYYDVALETIFVPDLTAFSYSKEIPNRDIERKESRLKEAYSKCMVKEPMKYFFALEAKCMGSIKNDSSVWTRYS